MELCHWKRQIETAPRLGLSLGGRATNANLAFNKIIKHYFMVLIRSKAFVHLKLLLTLFRGGIRRGGRCDVTRSTQGGYLENIIRPREVRMRLRFN